MVPQLLFPFLVHVSMDTMVYQNGGHGVRSR
jgi:hypothetical protein